VPHIHRFAVRSSGRDLTLVRRPLRDVPVVVAPVVKAEPALDEMLKSDLVELAESKGVESSGTKADLLARLGSAQ
jgi:hypothetical protein